MRVCAHVAANMTSALVPRHYAVASCVLIVIKINRGAVVALAAAMSAAVKRRRDRDYFYLCFGLWHFLSRGIINTQA